MSSKYKLITIDLSKQKAPDVDPKAIQQINLAGNLEENATMFFILEGVEEVVRTLIPFHSNPS